MRPRLVGLLVITCCLFVESPVFGQESTAEIRGRVMDAQNAAIPGDHSTITNQATGVDRQSVSNADGTYFITASHRACTSSKRSCQGLPSTIGK